MCACSLLAPLGVLAVVAMAVACDGGAAETLFQLEDEEVWPAPARAASPKLTEEGPGQAAGICKIIPCSEKVSGKAAFCTRHRRVVDNLRGQKKLTKEEKDTQKARLADVPKLSELVEQRLKDFPDLGGRPMAGGLHSTSPTFAQYTSPIRS